MKSPDQCLDRHLIMTLFTHVAHNGEVMTRSMAAQSNFAAVKVSKQSDQQAEACTC